MTAEIIPATIIKEKRKEKRLKDKAIQFVDIYQKEGKMIAAKWALSNIPEAEYKEAHVLITEEFRNRGYTFRGDM